MIWNESIECMDRESLRKIQSIRLKKIVDYVYHNTPFYRKKMQEMGITPDDINSIDDIVKLPFTTKDDLRNNYPFGLRAVPQSEIVRVQGTSGTTGNPKGVMLSQRNLTYDMSASSAYLFIPANTILLLPLHHTFGFTACVLCMIYRGYSVYINKSLKTILPDIKKSQPRHICLVPLFIEKFYKNIWKNIESQGKTALVKKMISLSNFMRKIGIDLRPILFKSIRDAFGGNLEMLISGGAPIDKNYIKAFDDFGFQIIEGYGITECSPIVSINRNKFYSYGSVGVAIPGSEVDIIDADENNEGEIIVKGDHVMLGYYNNEEATKDAFFDGWFRTGDIGKKDENGFVYITGRKKNIIILSNGKNVYPEEIETEFLRIPYVDEVIVFGRDDILCAEIYTETPDKKDEIKQNIKVLSENLPPYKQVKHIEFRDTEFEKTTTKKIKRF